MREIHAMNLGSEHRTLVLAERRSIQPSFTATEPFSLVMCIALISSLCNITILKKLSGLFSNNDEFSLLTTSIDQCVGIGTIQYFQLILQLLSINHRSLLFQFCRW